MASVEMSCFQAARLVTHPQLLEAVKAGLGTEMPGVNGWTDCLSKVAPSRSGYLGHTGLTMLTNSQIAAEELE